jgi:hypothetical protein
MRLVVSTQALSGFGGSESYAVTVADHLQRLGHDVWLHTLDPGPAATHAERLGLRVAGDRAALPGAPDALLVQDAVVAYELAHAFPATPQAFVAHSDIFDVQLPPSLPGVCALVVTLFDRVDRRVRAMTLDVPVLRLGQPIDVERFKPTAPLRHDRPVALAMGNYVHGARAELLEHACERAGIELRRVGLHAGGASATPQEHYNSADIVFGRARVTYEAMACGRAAYVFDHNGGEGWVTNANRAELSADNFGGQSRPIDVDVDLLAEDLGRYDPASGLANRDFVVAHHGATKHAARLVEALRELPARTTDLSDLPLREMSRLMRMYHRADAQAFLRTSELERTVAEREALRAEAGELGRHLEQTAGALAATTERLIAAEGARETAWADARRHADAAAIARAELAALTGTRRWKVLSAALSPADRLRRGRGQGLPPAPFIVGVPRSGTTLLRLMLDAHPDLAIPAETGFGLIPGVLPPGADRDLLAHTLLAQHSWQDLGIGEDELRAALAAVEPWSVGDGLRAVFRIYAAHQGKPRWGDKTPTHTRAMDAIARVLPEARFVHLIRDGRDVAASVRDLSFAPGDGSIEAIAADWRDTIVHARTLAGTLRHYRELRYERLLTDPGAELRPLCAFLELDFDPAMLRHHERARERMAELPAGEVSDGRVLTHEQRVASHVLVFQPPDASRAGRWRAALSAGEVARFEAVAGDLLGELGYERAA